MYTKSIAALILATFIIVFPSLASEAVETARDRGISVEPRPLNLQKLSNSAQNYSASYALIIGIDDYSNGWPRLRNAVKDAELIAVEMHRRGFKVTLSKNPKAKQLKRTLEQFYAVKGDDPKARLFVWYAGHGHTLHGEGYLVPADAPRPDWSNRNLVDFKLKALNMRRFSEYAQLASAKQSYTVFDSCFGGAIFTSANFGRVPIARHYDKAVPVGEFLTAGTAEQKVADDGNFRRLFIQALNGKTSKDKSADKNSDGFLTSRELGKYMTAHYSEITEGRQTPRSNTNSTSKFAFKILRPRPQHFVDAKPIDIWTYDKGTFERIIFDWPKAVSYKLDRTGNNTRLIFEAPADLKINSLVGDKLRNISNAKFYRGPSETILTLAIPADRYVHDFVDGNQIILDVVNPQLVEIPQQPVQFASYPSPRPQVVTRSLPDILSTTLSILQRAQPRPTYQKRYREVRVVRRHHRSHPRQRHRRHRR